MGTRTRPELSEKNPYWLERHRYYELKHFCMQYPIWMRAYKELDGYGQKSVYIIRAVTEKFGSDPTMACADALTYYANRLGMVDRAAYEAASDLAGYIVKGVTEGLSYDVLKVRYGIPCCKQVYYDAYRRFFWLLDRARK